jgi:hypothetical protein
LEHVAKTRKKRQAGSAGKPGAPANVTRDRDADVRDLLTQFWRAKEKACGCLQSWHPNSCRVFDQHLHEMREVLQQLVEAGRAPEASRCARAAGVGAGMLRSQLPEGGLAMMESTRVLDGGPWSRRLLEASRCLNESQSQAMRSGTTRSRTPRPPKDIGKVDQALVLLLLDDQRAGWHRKVPEMSNKELARCIGQKWPSALRTERTPVFIKLRERFRKNPKATLRIVDLPESLRALAASFLEDAGANW